MELVLFENAADKAREAIAYGVSSFMVDWETLGKEDRQLGFDTEIRPGTAADLAAIAAVGQARAWCRLNRYGGHTAAEVEAAIAQGAAVLLLPMVTRLDEVAGLLDLVAGRCAAGVLIETVEALALAPQLNGMPLDCIYFGLNDFAISRGSGSIFAAVADGSVESARRAFPGKRFGFGGLTAMDRGHPVPAARLLEEMERLDCDFTFLRRSFRRDAAKVPPGNIVHGIHDYWRHCAGRDGATRARDRQMLAALLNDL